jgi:hypothetical protein
MSWCAGTAEYCCPDSTSACLAQYAVHGPAFHAQDQLPTPFGLVRSGVAPDHPETKVCRP